MAALYDDNCGTITATYTGKTPGTNTNCSWSFTYHFTIDDGCGNDVTCDVVYSGGDTEDPALVDPLVSCTSLNSANNNWCLTVADAFDANTLESAVAALYDDNCGTITATYTGKTPGTNTNCSWSFTYHFTIDDGCGNDVTCDVVYSGGDTEDPALVDPLVSCTSLNSANNNWCLTVADAFDANTLESAVAALYDDNCGTITATYTGKTPGTNTNCSWSFTYHFTIDDGCGNDVTCDVVYSGGDTEDPALVDPLVSCQA